MEVTNEHKFPYKWHLKDGYPSKGIEKHGLKVFGTFICGGGSSMGYKLAGFEHLGGVEIDPKVAEVYKLNHNPKYLYVEDIRKFNARNDLPKALYNLDILEGSPPCSSFSMSGNREKDWGKKKKFREGQKRQILDDLVFEYIKTIEKLNPKVATLENVRGLIQGNARTYAKKINKQLKKIGYEVQLFLFNAASMGVPQKRERVFFICRRKDLNLPKINLSFSEKPVCFGQIRKNGSVGSSRFTEHDLRIWNNRVEGDKKYSDVLERAGNRRSNFSSCFVYDHDVCNTIVSADGSKLVCFEEPRKLSNKELIKCGTFPLDYNFGKVKLKYLIGMSVPPIMMAQIAHQIYLQWFQGGLPNI